MKGFLMITTEDVVKMKEPSIFLCPEITRENALLLIHWLRDHEVRKYLSDSQDVSTSIEQVINRVNLPILTHLFSQNGRFYMVYDKHNIAVGFVRLVIKGTQAEMVIVIGDRTRWGQKLGTNTIRETMKVAFFEHRVQKLIAKIHHENKRSIKAFINAGFRVEQDSPALLSFSITLEDYVQTIQSQAIPSSDIYITEVDEDRLRKLITEELRNGREKDGALQELEQEIDKATVVHPRKLSQFVVSMNSRARLRLNGDSMEVSLVYPRDADMSQKKLSVFSPVGTAILGYSEGDTISWKIPSGTAEIHIEKILYQPEAAGDYHL